MPPRDARLCPALERALPGDSDQDPPDYRRVMRPYEILFGDGEWHPVTIRARWSDKAGRLVVKVEWSAAGERWTETYIAEREKVREA
jgi:hypothetical protein